MEILFATLAILAALCISGSFYLGRGIDKSQVSKAKAPMNAWHTQPKDPLKSNQKTPNQKNESLNPNAFDGSDFCKIKDRVRGELKVADIRSGEPRLRNIYEEMLTTTKGKDGCNKELSELYETKTVVKTPRNYEELYNNFTFLADQIFTDNYFSLLETHCKVLSRKRKQLITIDDYGHQEREKWEEEKRNFIKKIVAPSLTEKFKNHPEINIDEIYNHVFGYTLNKNPDDLLETMDECIDYYSSKNQEKEIPLDQISSGLDYEKYVASIFEEHQWHTRLTKRSADNGADIIAQKYDITIIIQCKHYSSPVGNKSVQEVYSAKDYYDGDIACVITNQRFTKSAKSAAAKLNVTLLHHEQINYFLQKISSNQ
jgi:hypothetical protein